jgi:hypothetical protein
MLWQLLLQSVLGWPLISWTWANHSSSSVRLVSFSSSSSLENNVLKRLVLYWYDLIDYHPPI